MNFHSRVPVRFERGPFPSAARPCRHLDVWGHLRSRARRVGNAVQRGAEHRHRRRLQLRRQLAGPTELRAAGQEILGAITKP